MIWFFFIWKKHAFRYLTLSHVCMKKTFRFKKYFKDVKNKIKKERNIYYNVVCAYTCEWWWTEEKGVWVLLAEHKRTRNSRVIAFLARAKWSACIGCWVRCRLQFWYIWILLTPMIIRIGGGWATHLLPESRVVYPPTPVRLGFNVSG